MKREQAVKLAKTKFPNWTVAAEVPEDGITVLPTKTSPSVVTLVKKYSAAPRLAAGKANKVQLKTNGVTIIRLRPKKVGQDAPDFTKGAVIGEEGVIGMEG